MMDVPYHNHVYPKDKIRLSSADITLSSHDVFCNLDPVDKIPLCIPRRAQSLTVGLYVDTDIRVFEYSSRFSNRKHILASYVNCTRVDIHIGRSFYTIHVTSAYKRSCYGIWARRVSSDMMRLWDMNLGPLLDCKIHIRVYQDPARTSTPALEMAQI